MGAYGCSLSLSRFFPLPFCLLFFFFFLLPQTRAHDFVAAQARHAALHAAGLHPADRVLRLRDRPPHAHARPRLLHVHLRPLVRRARRPARQEHRPQGECRLTDSAGTAAGSNVSFFFFLPHIHPPRPFGVLHSFLTNPIPFPCLCSSPLANAQRSRWRSPRWRTWRASS